MIKHSHINPYYGQVIAILRMVTRMEHSGLSAIVQEPISSHSYTDMQIFDMYGDSEIKKRSNKNKLFTLLMAALLTVTSFPPVLADEEDEAEDNPVVEVTEHGIEITKSCAKAIDEKLDMSEIEGSTAVLVENDSITVSLSEVMTNDEFKKIEYVTGAEVFYSEEEKWYFAIVHFEPSLNLREKAALVAEDARVLRITPPTGIPVDDEMIELPFSDATPENRVILGWAQFHIAKGYGNNIFGTGRDCTRKDFLIFLWRLMGKPLGWVSDVRFNDIGAYAKESASYEAIAWAFSKGVVKGYPDGGFHPEETLKRKDAMIMLYRAVKPNGSFEALYKDVNGIYPVTSDTYKAIGWAVKTGVADAFDDLFMPLQECKREEAILFLFRYEFDGLIPEPVYEN